MKHVCKCERLRMSGIPCVRIPRKAQHYACRTSSALSSTQCQLLCELFMLCHNVLAVCMGAEDWNDAVRCMIMGGLGKCSGRCIHPVKSKCFSVSACFDTLEVGALAL